VNVVRVEWGQAGARELGRTCPIVVVCDVLSYSTAVSIATARGVTVWPHAWDDLAGAAAQAVEVNALLAGPRGSQVSLAPGSLAVLPAGTGVVLPSPNGAECCLVAAAAGATVVAGSLRNASAVAAWIAADRGDVGLVAAGERWPDGSLRPAYEDWIGAGTIAGLLADRFVWSAEAEAAAVAARVRRSLFEVASGAELDERGYDGDVVIAQDLDADDVVPVLVDGRFVPG
jgi:2-phosphosulfolactate phosphatase